MTVPEYSGSPGIAMSNPGKTVDLQFENGMHGLTIQLLHGQITDWRATGTLSLIDLDVRPENTELLLRDAAGNKYTYIFKFD
jgi:hypothetical protein